MITNTLTADQLSVFHSLPERYLILSPDLHILTASDPYLAATRTERESITGKLLAEVFPSDSSYLVNLRASLQHVLFTRQSHRIARHQYAIVREGEVRYWDLVATPVLNEEGRVHYIIHHLREAIPARQRSSLSPASWPQKESLLYTLLDEAPVGIVIYRGPNYVIELINKTLCTLVGRSREQALNAPLFELLPEAAGQGFEELLDRVMATGESYVAQELPSPINRHGRRDTVYWNFAYFPYRDDQDQVVGVVAIATEVTKQVETRRKVEAGEKRFRNLLNGIPQMTWTNLPDGSVNFYSQRWYDYTGLTYEQLRDWGWKPIVHADDLDDMLATYLRALESGQEFMHENRLKQRDGTYRWHLNRSVPVRDDEGEIELWVGTSTDIHEKKLAGEALQGMAQHLAATNNELAVANEDVRASNEELASSNQQLSFINADLDNFIYTASHDLKAPITNIQSLINLLEKSLSADSRDSPRTQKVLGMIEQSVARFMGTIADLSEITRIQKQADQPTELIDLSAVIEEVTMDIALDIEAANAHLDVEVRECEAVRFPPKNLRSIIYNLLSNAVKYRDPHRTPIIRIRCKKIENYQVLTVADNGLGMDLTRSNKLFTMFQRFHDHVEGTGVGLYIVKKIVENSGGKIEVASQLGKGTTFTVYFTH